VLPLKIARRYSRRSAFAIFVVPVAGMRLAQFLDQAPASPYPLQQFREYRQQAVAALATCLRVRDRARREFSVRAGMVTSVMPPAFFTVIRCGTASWYVREMTSMPVTRLASFRSTSMPLVRQQDHGIDLVVATMRVDELCNSSSRMPNFSPR